MADSLELVGVKGVRKQTGTEMSIIRPLRGGDTHQVKEWWRKSVNTTYATCTIFKVTTGDGTVKLALPTGKFETTNVKIIHDGNFNFTFVGINELDRAALFTENMELIEHYIFPSISGGKIVTVTPPGAADRPNAGPTETFTAVAFDSGKMNGLPGDKDTYTFTHTGTATDIVDVLTSSEDSDEIGGSDGHTVTFGTVGGTRTLTVTSSSVNAQVSGLTDTRDVTIYHLIRDVTVSTNDGLPTDGDTGFTYTATINGTAENLSYAWTATGSASINGDADQQSVTIDFSGTDESIISCEVSSSDSFVQDSPQTGDITITPTPNVPPSGPADSVTLVTTTTSAPSGPVAATATTSANGSGLTVTYDSDGSDASNLQISDAGSGYQDGDSFTVDGDTVTGTVSIAAILTANNAVADVSYVVTQAGGYYYIDGAQQAEVTANAGETIYFDLSDGSLSNHPFKIYTDSSKTTEVTVGVTSSATGLLFTPPISGTFSYQCASHAGMGGTITIS